MTKQIVLEVPKIIDDLPTPKQMESFCRDYSSYEWSRLSDNYRFREALTTDLKKARMIAEEMLGKKS